MYRTNQLSKNRMTTKSIANSIKFDYFNTQLPIYDYLMHKNTEKCAIFRKWNWIAKKHQNGL